MMHKKIKVDVVKKKMCLIFTKILP
jgi:hypothetical protein